MPLFNPQTAAIAGQLGAKARWSKPKAEPAPVILPPPPVIMAEPQRDDFQSRRLKRVRDQLSRIDTELESCDLDDSKRLKELADASARLSDQEFKLAGRPSPGSMKPTGPGKAITSRSHDDAAPWVPTIAPDPAPPVQPPAPAKPLGWEYDL